MRIIFFFVIMVFAIALQAQTTLPGSFQNNVYNNYLATHKNMYDSNSPKKWFVTSYTGITAGYSFFRGSNASFVAAPISFQLNHRLTNNLYAFAGITAAPTYINFNRAFTTTDLNKINSRNAIYQPGDFSMYSAATMGLMYINDARTFFVSGSVSVERSNYPLLYNNQVNTNRKTNMPSFR
jgi:hypothetical protein